MEKIYLDNAATSWPKPEGVYAAIDYFNRNVGGNPGRGTTNLALASARMVLETRELLAELFHISHPLRISFTPNITESLNVALKGCLAPGDHLIFSSMEHNSIARPAYALAKQGIEISIVPCSSEGRLNIKALVKAIKKNTKMISLSHASNVTGTIQPISEVGEICQKNGLIFVVDSAQSAGILPIDVQRQHIDILTFTGHKGLLGPQGTGGIYIRPGLTVKPLKEGGTGSQSLDTNQPEFMPDSLESGTLNTPGIVGLGAGVRFLLKQGIDTIRQHEEELTQLLRQNLLEIPKLKVYGPANCKDKAAVLSFTLEHINPAQVSFRLENEFGIITRAGLHCSPLAHQTLGTLPHGACRLSPGFFNTREEIEITSQAIAEIAQK
ncbi:MAG: aminotransferase class V-fold PLP-dependent enzyme [Pelosinus sp.]|nr:aminotransferase class V-fold PLP-dependent enzyme [Pelosinus sp.]